VGTDAAGVALPNTIHTKINGQPGQGYSFVHVTTLMLPYYEHEKPENFSD
jgi:hypothetical protein